MVLPSGKAEGNRTMTMKALLTITMTVTAMFVFKDVPAKTLINIMIAVIVVAMFWIPKGEKRTITEKTIITVTRDDPMAKIFEEQCTKENGWTKEECTVSVTYTRIEYFNSVARMDKK